MTVLAFPNVVPDDTYRIRSSERMSPELYLELQADNEVKPVELKANSDAQKWKISAQQDDLYKIESVGTPGRFLVAKPYYDDGITRYSLGSGTSGEYWTLEPRGDDFVMGMPDNALCLELTPNNRVMLWERQGKKHQRWILDSVDTGKQGGNLGGGNTGGGNTGGGNTGGGNTGGGNTSGGNTGGGNTGGGGGNTGGGNTGGGNTGGGNTGGGNTGGGNTGGGNTGGGGTGGNLGGNTGGAIVSPGLYNIKNRYTDSEICIWTGYQYDNAPVLVWPATGTARTYSARAWQVTPTNGGYTITNSYWVAKGPRSLKEGPFVNTAQNVCRLIPVPGTQYYHIATSNANDSRVLMDSQPPRAINQPATMAQFNKDEHRQQWEFTPAH